MPASPSLVELINDSVRRGHLFNQAGNRIDRTIEGGFVRAAGDLLYAVVDSIPVLLRDEAISLSQVGCGSVEDISRPI
jgi:uncharacterized protein YbaR (Trm112 family)